MGRSKQVKLVTFEVPKEFHKNMKSLVKKMPHLQSVSQLLRQAIVDFENNLDHSGHVVKGKSDTSELKDLITEMSKGMKENNAAVLSQLTLISNHLKVDSYDEIDRYLEEISEILFEKKLSRTLKVTLEQQLIGLLDFPFLGEFLPDWLDKMERLEFITRKKGKVIWNEKKIRGG